jgi:hypothetical protein
MSVHYINKRQAKPVLVWIKRSHWYFAIAAACFLWAALIVMMWVVFRS